MNKNLTLELDVDEVDLVLKALIKFAMDEVVEHGFLTEKRNYNIDRLINKIRSRKED